MNIGGQLADFILAIPGVATAIGSRIYPDGLPQRFSMRIRGEVHEQAKLPAVTYRLVSAGPEAALSATRIPGFTATRYQITAYGANRAEADRVANLIRGDQNATQQGLENYRGLMGNATTGQVAIDSVFLANWLTEKEQPTTGSNRPRYLVLADYLIQHHY